MARAREVAIERRIDRVEHNKGGRIADSDSYGNDPCPPKDRKH